MSVLYNSVWICQSVYSVCSNEANVICKADICVVHPCCCRCFSASDDSIASLSVCPLMLISTAVYVNEHSWHHVSFFCVQRFFAQEDAWQLKIPPSINCLSVKIWLFWWCDDAYSMWTAAVLWTMVYFVEMLNVSLVISVRVSKIRYVEEWIKNFLMMKTSSAWYCLDVHQSISVCCEQSFTKTWSEGSGGVRVFAARGKRLCCCPHPRNQISNWYSYGYND